MPKTLKTAAPVRARSKVRRGSRPESFETAALSARAVVVEVVVENRRVLDGICVVSWGVTKWEESTLSGGRGEWVGVVQRSVDPQLCAQCPFSAVKRACMRCPVFLCSHAVRNRMERRGKQGRKPELSQFRH